MGFWDEPTTLLDPVTNAPLMGRQYLTAQKIQKQGGVVTRLIAQFNGALNNYDDMQLSATSFTMIGGVRYTRGEGRTITIPERDARATSVAGGAADGTIVWDSTLGKPIFRKASSATGWCDATGADV
ncbi:hypothetical protein SEA_DESIREEROSE_26 [Microbacterium phage DesireeRose]|nr:hypothetical protein SEA_DESIREEROSE_26 [Microbacterium phage DesireeRose]